MGVKVTRNTLKACVLSLFGAAVLCAPSDALARNLVVKVWRGETHAMALPDDVRPGKPEAGIAFRYGSAQEIRYLTDTDKRQMASCLDKVAWDGGKGAHRWIEISVAADVKPGWHYIGDLQLKVIDRVMPPAKDWKYFLDIWQHPWAVSRYFGVEPFSKEHYAKMEPLWRLLASAGCKVLTCTLVDKPWNYHCYDPYHAMIRKIKKADGTWRYDYTLFDEYVAFGRKCGLGPDIACYSMCPLNYSMDFEDESGKVGRQPCNFKHKGYEEYWGPFLKDFKRHLEEKGWFKDAYIAMDEREVESVNVIRGVIDKYAPGMKMAMAGGYKPADVSRIRMENYCSDLAHAVPEFLALVPERRAKGYTTTYYVCCGPEHPNNFMSSPASESYWTGFYPAVAGLDGFLRWAWNCWPKDPETDAAYGLWPAGDTFLAYPDGSPSIRFLELRNGIVAAEKVRLLRESGKLDEAKFKELAALYDPKRAMGNHCQTHVVRGKTQDFVNAE